MSHEKTFPLNNLSVCVGGDGVVYGYKMYCHHICQKQLQELAINKYPKLLPGWVEGSLDINVFETRVMLCEKYSVC